VGKFVEQSATGAVILDEDRMARNLRGRTNDPDADMPAWVVRVRVSAAAAGNVRALTWAIVPSRFPPRQSSYTVKAMKKLSWR